MFNWILHFWLAMAFYIVTRNWKLTLSLILAKEFYDDVICDADLLDSMFDVAFGIVGAMFGELTLRK